MTGRAVSIPDAAAALDVSEATLRRWIAAGAPQARRGGRGRGRAALVDPHAVAAWHRAQGPQARPMDTLETLAADLPDVLAQAAWAAFMECDGPQRRQLAGVLAAAWYLAACAVADRIRRDAPDIADPEHLPEPIERLRKIAHA